ncbi:MAG: hypothetical protein K1X29_05925 [Bdellovibrionales bacterium]|nr:hypothetical protein [Bdellovibrionales bacterium]
MENQSGKLLGIVYFLLLSVQAITGVGCTRGASTKAVKLILPFNTSQSQGKASLSAGDQLRHAFINIQIPSRSLPLVQEFDFENNPIPWGSTVDLTVNDVPQGKGYLIQFLGVFSTIDGASYMLTYGDAAADIGSGQNLINITATAAGSASREGRIAGRYFNRTDNSNNPTGPTGTLIAYYIPDGKPKMALDKSSIIEGWFNIFALDTIPITYELVGDTNTILFSSLTLNSSLLASGPQLLHMQVPSFYRRNQRNSAVEVRRQVASDYYLGFLKDPSMSNLSLSTYKICYANDIQEGLQGWFGAYDGATDKFSAPIKYDSSSSGTSSDLKPVGGTAVSYSSWILNESCNADNSSSQLTYYHHRNKNGSDEFAGLRPPFRLIDPYSMYGGYLRKKYILGTNTIELKWKYLGGAAPAVSGTGLNGVDILMKNYNSGSTSTSTSNTSGDSTCANFLSQGYSVVATLTDGSDHYEYSEAGLSATNHFGYMFALCGYKTSSSNEKKYLGAAIRSDCSWQNCGEMDHFGWGITSATVSTSGSAESTLGVHSARVENVSVSNDLYTVLTLNGTAPSNFTSSDSGGEVMLLVVGEGSTGDCGTTQGQSLKPGIRAFTKILLTDGSYLKIPKGTFLDDINNNYLYASSSNSANFCYVTATKVPHFTTLTLGANLSVGGFNYSTNGGGIVPFRVSEQLTISSGVSMSAASLGFASGGSGNYAGAGHKKAPSSGNTVANSGGNTASGISGGGAGPFSLGGSGLNSLGNLNIGSGGGNAPLSPGGGLQFMFGGGGGGYGGSGGGIIFIAARYLTAGSNSTINVSGGNQISTGHGGGGGGTVLLMSDKADGSLSVLAKGGNSSTSNTSGQGGAGGGGLIYKLICSNNLSSFTTDVASGTGPAAAGSTLGASDGQVFDGSNVIGNNPACQN